MARPISAIIGMARMARTKPPGPTVSPTDFILAAERYGITPQIDRWVVENALRWVLEGSDNPMED